MSMRDIDLAFLEPLEPEWKYTSKYFPSKVGGKPAFLVLDQVPGVELLTCETCGQILRFVLQIYAPLETRANAFHRSLYIFACGRTAQCANQVRCLRSQLPRSNRFYRETPPDYDALQPDQSYEPKPQDYGLDLCVVCGIRANNKCSECRKVDYCSRQHQIVHWKAGGHKLVCPELKNSTIDGKGDNDVDVTQKYINSGLLFPELAIDMSPGSDEEDNDQDDEEDEQENAEKMEKYKQMLKMVKPEFQNENLDDAEVEVDEDLKTFNRFAKHSSLGEIIRYRKEWCNLSGQQVEQSILWISCKNRLDLGKQVPKCDKCGAKRCFEFQIMPHLLKQILPNKSLEDHLDWGTILVFSCSQSCSSSSYLPEFVFVQNVN